MGPGCQVGGWLLVGLQVNKGAGRLLGCLAREAGDMRGGPLHTVEHPTHALRSLLFPFHLDTPSLVFDL